MISVKPRLFTALLPLLWAALSPLAQAQADVTLYDGQRVAEVLYDAHQGDAALPLAAQMLVGDLHDLTGKTPVAARDRALCRTTCVLLGLSNAPRVQALARRANISLDDLSGQWEVYRRFVVRDGAATYVVIAGSDLRGAIYGAVDLSRSLGISPWSWWADVTPRQQSHLSVSEAAFTSKPPSVQYRGIFLNDEDWGLEPWAAATQDPAKGNIGPNTYRRVFELMWRLKANTLWPAMHTVSTPFYSDLANPKLAHDYAIVMGTSHAEPMMRNNLREWDESKSGAFDFTRNGKKIATYWKDRIKQSAPYESIYTVGLRGIHDGPMQGATTTQERSQVLEHVIDIQRDLLTQTLKRPAATTPQVYVAYHELQEAYDSGLKVPDDVTLMWADDNYGYLRRLSGPAEQARSGGAGVYYHLSYWGRPHDYLWLGTTQPGLIREEMERAFDTNARRMWIVNVGDIKPIEYLSQYFLDLAFDANLLTQPADAHLRDFMREQFGDTQAEALAGLMRRYYDLAFERKPEFMGFGQAEWVTPNRHTDYVSFDGQEAEARLKAYRDLTVEAEAIGATLPADRQAAFYELVLYPVRASANLNARILNLDLADLYAREQRASVNSYVDTARAAHAELVEDTERYNALLGGKWRGIMDMAPRRLPVFDEPVWPSWTVSPKTGCDLLLSGQWINDHNTLTFVAGRPQTRPVTLFSHQPVSQDWSLQTPVAGLTLSNQNGALNGQNHYQTQLSLSYDGASPPGDKALKLMCGGAEHTVYVRILPAMPMSLTAEDNRRVTLRPDLATLSADWERIGELGSLGSVLRARQNLTSASLDDAAKRAPLTYRFATSSESGGTVKLIALPTHPTTPDQGLRVLVRLDDGPLQLLDVSTIGRSDPWRANVLSNAAIKTFDFRPLPAGEHTLSVYAVDPGLMIDRIEIDLDGARPHYGAIRTDPSGP